MVLGIPEVKIIRQIKQRILNKINIHEIKHYRKLNLKPFKNTQMLIQYPTSKKKIITSKHEKVHLPEIRLSQLLRVYHLHLELPTGKYW